MLQTLIAIAGIFLTIFFVVGTHEFGHFITARALGVRVLCFSIGFGKKLFSWRDKAGTEYILALIPLGGYVRMLDESEAPVADSQLRYAYNRQPFYKKFLIVLAGPLTNLICALLLYWVIFSVGFVTMKPVTGPITPGSIAAEAGMKPDQQIIKVNNELTPSWMRVIFQMLYLTGDHATLPLEAKDMKTAKTYQYTLNLTNWRMDDLKPDPLESIGITPYVPDIPMVVGYIAPNSPAAASLHLGDKILAIDEVKIATWEQLVTIIKNHPEKKVSLTVARQGKTITLPITISYKRNFFMKKSGYLGAAPTFDYPENLLQKIKYSPADAFTHAWKEVSNFTYLNFLLIGKMVTGKLSFQSLGGPITIFDNAGTALNSGYIAFMSFLAFLSIAIGTINFLPIPGLDGGHLLVQAIEAIVQRPIPDRILVGFYKLGFLLIIFLLFQSLANDIMRLI